MEGTSTTKSFYTLSSATSLVTTNKGTKQPLLSLLIINKLF